MSVKLLTEHRLEFLSLKNAAQARLSLHLSKCHIVGKHMSWLKFFTEASFLDLHLFISNDIVSTKIYDKRVEFDFELVDFSFFR